MVKWEASRVVTNVCEWQMEKLAVEMVVERQFPFLLNMRSFGALDVQIQHAAVGWEELLSSRSVCVAI